MSRHSQSASCVVPFTVRVADREIEDLRARLENTRWPEVANQHEWEYGIAVDSIRRLVTYWREDFDWRNWEERLNSLGQYTADLRGQRIHFLHYCSGREDAIPLLITHGWPGSVLEFLALAPQLADSSQDVAFDVVVPSILGFGFSSKPAALGFNNWNIAELWADLMTALGYDSFVVQGGDIGASVSTILALRHPHRVRGLHLNYIPGSYRPHVADDNGPTVEELEYLRFASEWFHRFGAYAHLHQREPQTLAYALNDSPVGLLAWIADKFVRWSDSGGDLHDGLLRDLLIANVSLYWFTGTIESSMRLYFENAKAPLHFQARERVAVPTAMARFPHELPIPPRSWVERGYNVQRWTEMPRGGHFAAIEQPSFLAGDIREFVRSQLCGVQQQQSSRTNS